MIFLVSYSILLIFLTFFSYGFVDANSPFPRPLLLYNLVHFHRGWTTIIYSLLVIFLFLFYWQFLSLVRKGKLNSREVWKLIGLTVLILFFSFPGFSFDIFNYIATAKVTFQYQENPYLTMPIEIPNEPILAFMHAANKTALYGPIWILVSALPHFLSFGNLILTVFTFKALVFLFYLGLIWLIWELSNKDPRALAIFALNPLVVIETLVGGHNDAVMMFLALLSFYFLKKKNFWLALGSFFLSIMIKFATIFLLPIFILVIWQARRQQKIVWPKIWLYAAYSMLVIFFLSPLREEIYSWYLIWPLAFSALLPSIETINIVIVSFSFGLLFRIAPFLYTRSWSGPTPLIKKIVTFLPPVISLFYLNLKKWLKRS